MTTRLLPVSPKTSRWAFGYSTSYHAVDLFDPEISTGPAIIMPTAGLMRIVGNQYWVPGLAVTLAIWATLAVLLRRLRENTQDHFSLALIVLSAGLIVFGTSEFGLLGELPAVFLVATCFAVLANESEKPRWSRFGAGIGFGVAVYSKLIVTLALPAVLIVPLVEALSGQRKNDPGRLSWRDAGWFCVGLVLPALAWQLYQLAAVGFSVTTWLGVKSREAAFLSGSLSLSGIGQIQEASPPFDAVLRNASRNFTALSGYFGGWLRLAPGVAASMVAFSAISAHRNIPPAARRLPQFLFCATLLHLGWWFCLSPTGWYRHLLPAILYGIVLSAVLAATSIAVSRRLCATYLVGLALSVALILPAWYPQSGDFSRVFKWGLTRDSRLSALLQTRDKLLDLQRDQSVVLVGCGWWYAILNMFCRE